MPPLRGQLSRRRIHHVESDLPRLGIPDESRLPGPGISGGHRHRWPSNVEPKKRGGSARNRSSDLAAA